MSLRTIYPEFVRDRRGIALIEGVLILGLLVGALLQMIVITQYYGASTRINQATDGIANMVSQASEIETSDLARFELAASHFLRPFEAPDELLVAQIVFRSDGAASSDVADGGWLLSTDSSITATPSELTALTDGMGLPGDAVIIVRMSQTDTARLQFGPSPLPNTIEATAFAKTRSARLIQKLD